MSRSESAARALLAAQAAWLAAGFVFPALPAWTMFAKVERSGAVMIDRAHRESRIDSFFPRDVYLIDKSGARSVAAFVCRRHPDLAPWTILWADGLTENACKP